MTLRNPLLKQAVCRAIDLAGHIKGAMHATDKGKSQVGRWHARSEPDLPNVEDALAIDEVAVIQGKRPEILHAYASGLGFVAIRLPEAVIGEEAEALALVEAVEECGQVASAVRDMVADGVRTDSERERCTREIDDTLAAFTRLRAIVAGPVGLARERGENRG